MMNMEEFWDNAMDMIKFDYSGTSPEKAADIYCDRCGRVSEELEIEEELAPICAICGQKIDPRRGLVTDTVHIGRKKVELPFCISCYEAGFDGGVEWSENEIRSEFMNGYGLED